MKNPDFLIHDSVDNVGVVVVEDATEGRTLNGLNMETGAQVAIIAKNDVPLGHKIALADLPEGETVIKYGADIGKIVAPVSAGEHTHTHNLKTKRW